MTMGNASAYAAAIEFFPTTRREVDEPRGPREIVEAVEALLRRGWASRARRRPERLAFGDVEIDVAARAVSRGGKPVMLSPKEFDLLEALVRRDGAAASRGELLAELWEHESLANSRTVDTHIYTLRRKLEGDPTQPRYILTVRKTGYRVAR